MRRTLARVTAGAAAAVTGLLLSGPPAAGQMPQPARPATGPQHPPAGMHVPGSAGVRSDDPARLAEVGVEMAWLTDPVTFPYHLAARATPEGLEVRGFVPSSVIHERAVKLARQHCDWPVLDKIQVHSAMAVHLPAAPGEQLRPAVDAALRAACPALAPGVTAHYRSYGQVVLTGGVPSLEAKLALSQALRRVPGCRSVINQIHVGPQMAAAPARPAPQQVASGPVASPAKSAPAPARPDSTKPAPAARAEFAGSAPVAARPEPPRPPVSLSPYKGPAAPPGGDVKQVTFSGLTKPAAEVGPNLPKLETWQPAAPKAPATTDTKATPAPQQLKPPAPPSPLLPVLDRPSERPGAALKPPQPKVAQSSTYAAAPPPAPVNPAPPPPAPVKTAVTPPAPVKATPTAPQNGGPMVAPAPRPGTPPAPPPLATRPAPSGEPYVVTGMVLIDAEPAPAGLSAPALAGIRQAVERACAGKALDVEAVSLADGSLAVRLRAANKADADHCAARVLSMPEVAPYKSRLKLGITVPE